MLEGLAVMSLEFNGFIDAREWHNGLFLSDSSQFLEFQFHKNSHSDKNSHNSRFHPVEWTSESGVLKRGKSIGAI